jgi:hypothetical protein
VSPAAGRGLTFVIVCLGRTGSTHLQFLLDSHPDIRCFGELFTGNAHTFDEVFLASSGQDPVAYVNGLTDGLEESAIGFKLPLGSLRAHPEAARVLELEGLRFIRLQRRNRLALFVSRRMLAATRVPQSTHGTYGETTVKLEPQQCLNALAKIAEHDAYLDGLVAGRPTHRVDYEDLVGGLDLAPVQRFLGVEPAPLTSVFERVRKRPLAETIENWDEVSAALEGTPYESFLADDLA